MDGLEQQYVKADVVARLFGVSVRRIQQLTQEGIIPTEKHKYDLYPTIQRYIQYLSEKAYNRSNDNKETALKEQKLKAEIRLKESQAELHQLKTEIAAGKYLSLDDIMLDYGRFLTNFKKLALAIPGRVSGIIATVCEPVQAREIENDLSNEISQMLDTFVMAANAGGDTSVKKHRGRPKKKVDDQAVHDQAVSG